MGQTGRKDTLYHYTDFGALDGIVETEYLQREFVG